MDARVDAGTRDAAPEDAHEELAELEAIEVTAHQITWRWNPEQVPQDVVEYALRWATSSDAVATAEAWDQRSDPNLGHRTSPFGAGTVERTRVLDLSPGTTYFARLYGRNEGGGEVALAEGTAATREVPGSALLLFDEELPQEASLVGFNEPGSAAESYQGSGALWFAAEVTDAAASNLARPIPPQLAERWEDAYLEMFVLARPAHAIAYVEVMLDGVSEGDPMRYHYFALPPHEAWQRLEVPLSAFSPELDGIDGFGIGAMSWGEGSTVYLDAVSIRY
jgi:hypothetical protein